MGERSIKSNSHVHVHVNMSHSNELKTGCDTVELILFVGGHCTWVAKIFPVHRDVISLVV